jgi:AraC-like DNA-binding protein
MKGTSTVIASGPGWRVRDIVCTAGPQDQPYEEQHEGVSIAVVTAGTFQYRSSLGAAVLEPGALLLGNAGTCFECGHEHGIGDRCLAFAFEPGSFESIAAGTPGASSARLSLPRLPPLPALMPLVAAAEAARDDPDGGALEEIAIGLAGAVLAAAHGGTAREPAPRARDARRITEALRRIEADAAETLSLSDLAREAGMSAFHFLRVFRALVGMPPHQYLLRTRLHRAAVRLRRSDEPIATIAFDAGFNDLSTFNRRFRRVMGASPSAYRVRRV